MPPSNYKYPTELKDIELDLDFEPLADYSENLVKDTRDIKKALHIEQSNEGVHVIAFAVHPDPDKNKMFEIPAADGDALTFEVHDLVRDVFHVAGVSFHEIGKIPVNYTLTIDGVPWEEEVPLPFSVIRRYMSEDQRKAFESWKSEHRGHAIEFLQVRVVC